MTCRWPADNLENTKKRTDPNWNSSHTLEFSKSSGPRNKQPTHEGVNTLTAARRKLNPHAPNKTHQVAQHPANTLSLKNTASSRKNLFCC